MGSIPGSGRSPGVENGNPLQYSCLENSMDREAWRATGHGVQSRTLSLLAGCKLPRLQLSVTAAQLRLEVNANGHRAFWMMKMF